MKDPHKVNQLFNFVHKVKMGRTKTKAMTNFDGLFLAMIGLRNVKPKEGNPPIKVRLEGKKKRAVKRS